MLRDKVGELIGYVYGRIVFLKIGFLPYFQVVYCLQVIRVFLDGHLTLLSPIF